jgi:tight adherence protein B
VIPLTLALLAAFGVHLAWTSFAFGWTGAGLGPRRARRVTAGVSLRTWLAQAGLDDVAPAEFTAVSGTLAAVGAVFGFAMFGAVVPTLATALAAAGVPLLAYRSRRRTRREVAQEAWPSMIEEIRILTSSVGRSVPQALFEAAGRAPVELRGGFAAAQREWLITTDFSRTIAVLKARLADPTADAACETLLVAHEVGGTDLDRRLEALAEDRRADLQGRKDARSEQAGVRFARRFVLIVPMGMAFAGMSVGDGRAAYRTPTGQLAVLIALALIAACWVWAGRIMRLPDERRVFEA